MDNVVKSGPTAGEKSVANCRHEKSIANCRQGLVQDPEYRDGCWSRTNDVMDGKRAYSTDKENDVAMEVGRNPRLVMRC